MAGRTLLPLILLIAPAALAAQAMTPEEAVAAQQAEIREVVNQVCPESADPNNVVVCGRRERFARYRVPSADPDLAMRTDARAGGEQMAALAGDTCLRLCHQPVMVSVLGLGSGGATGAIPAIERGIDRLLHPD